MAQPSTVTTTKNIERCQISPPPGSVPPTTLPLTFFDMPWTRFNPKRLFFFDFPHPTHHFTLTALPKLKHSLSLALVHFFPFAAVLVSPPPPQKPHLLFSEGGSVSFTVAESTADFDHLISNDPRDITDYDPFYPTLPPPSSADGASPLLSVQATIFPNSGVAIGLTFKHVAADGRAFIHFLKSWAFFCRTLSSQGPSLVDLESPLSHDRDAILDPYGLEHIFLKQYWDLTSGSDSMVDTSRRQENRVRATFVMGPAHIAKLKQWVSAQCEDKGEALTWHLSTFVAAVAYTWVQMIRSQQTDTIPNNDENYHFGFLADCRNHNGLGYTIPETYFGNCLALCHVTLKRSEVVGEDGIFHAAKAIGKKVRDFHRAPLRGADKWMSEFKVPESESLVIVAGSPKFRVYDTDFGWGRLRKSLTYVLRGISLAECKEGGIEIGVPLDKDQMKTFSASFHQGLKPL